MQCARCGQESTASARFCSNCGAALDDAPRGEGERRHATIVFSDLSGYTALNERLDPEEVEDIMGRVKREAVAAIERHGGTVNQFVGDEVMALFGVPTARRDDAVRAVRAALAVHLAVRGIAAEIGARIGQRISMHTGINTGLVIVRRSDARAGQYLLTGDTVNTAARLLKLAQEDEIVAGQDTWRELAGQFDGEAGPAAEVKGKEKPLVPWRIRGERAAAAGERRPMFGRDAELARFDDLLRASGARGTGGLAVVRGDPGIGKSRLAAEFAARAEAAGHAVHRALVLDFSAGRGGDAIRSLARALSAAAPVRDMPAEREVFLGELLDLPLRAELRALAAAMDEAARNRGTIEVLCELVREAASRAPLLLLVEDVHWADPWTLAHLAALAEVANRHPAVLLVTSRVENDPTARIAGTAAPALFELGPIGADDARGLAAQFPAISESLARSYIERADGNPLFLEQLLLNAGESALHNLPGSIQALVLARMDRLPPSDRAALQAASVLGQRFSLDALRSVLGAPAQDCRELLAHQLLRPEGNDYLFWHALIRDGAYESLLKSRRRELHARAAEWFLARDTALAAEHLDRAEDARAAAAYLAASDEESGRYRYERALALAERGLALAATDGDRYRLLSARGRILLDAGRARESVPAWQEALALAAGAAERCRALIGVASGMRILDRAGDGLAALAEAEALAVAPGLELERSRLHHLRGNLYFGLGRADECLREHEAALANALAAGSKEAEANALGGLGDAYYIRGRMRSAHEQFGRCVELAHAQRLGRIEVANMHMEGWTAHYLHRLEDALAIGARSVEMAVAVSHHRVETVARALTAYIGGWLMADLDPAQRHLEIAIRRARELGSRRFESQLLTYEAQFALARGERGLALRLARDTLAHCRVHGMEFFGAVALGVLGRVAEDPQEGARCNAEALALLDRGMISHNHFEFYMMAIDGALERAAWDEAEHYCARLQRYTAQEALPLADFVAARGRALAAAGRGRGSAAALATLAAEARAARLIRFLPALEAARARLESGRGGAA